MTDSSESFAEAMLMVTVTPNSAPTLGNYPTTTVLVGNGTTVTPDAAPSDNVTITGITVSAPGFTGTRSINPASGVVTISNAGPVNTYTVTVTATDNCDAMTTASFTLNVNAPLPSLGNYEDSAAFLGSTTEHIPDAAPMNIVRINVSTSTSFKGSLVANTTTGRVRVINAHPAGTYLVTVKAFDSMGASATRTFEVVIETWPVSCPTPGFVNAADVSTGENAASVAIGDFDSDGNQDFVTANRTPSSALSLSAISITKPPWILSPLM